jgi:ion channel
MRCLRSPIGWLVSIYVVGILGFSIAYWKYDCDFYQTGATHEKFYKDASKSVISGLETGTRRCIELEAKEQQPPLPEFQPLVIIDDLTSSADAVIVNGRAGTKVIPPATPPQAPHFHKFQILIPYTEMKHLSQQLNHDPIPEFVPVQFSLVSGDPGQDVGDMAFDMLVKYSNAPNSAPRIQMPGEDIQALRDVIIAQRGTVDNLPDQLARMTYFSVVTQTTLGFGDITPVSRKMRITVGCQAVFGVVVVGLFLNAVAGRAAKKQSERLEEMIKR